MERIGREHEKSTQRFSNLSLIGRAALPVRKGKRMSRCVLGFQDIDKTKIMVVGAKGANLGEVSKIEGTRVL